MSGPRPKYDWMRPSGTASIYVGMHFLGNLVWEGDGYCVRPTCRRMSTRVLAFVRYGDLITMHLCRMCAKEGEARCL